MYQHFALVCRFVLAFNTNQKFLVEMLQQANLRQLFLWQIAKNVFVSNSIWQNFSMCKFPLWNICSIEISQLLVVHVHRLWKYIRVRYALLLPSQVNKLCFVHKSSASFWRTVKSIVPFCLLLINSIHPSIHPPLPPSPSSISHQIVVAWSVHILKHLPCLRLVRIADVWFFLTCPVELHGGAVFWCAQNKAATWVSAPCWVRSLPTTSFANCHLCDCDWMHCSLYCVQILGTADGPWHLRHLGDVSEHCHPDGQVQVHA